MKTMKAIVFQEEMSFDSMAILDVPYPTPGPGEAVVQIEASALNHRDVWITMGLYPGIETPKILGSDGAGIVVEVGEGVEEKWLNMPVMINPSLEWGDNSRVQQDKYRILGMPDDGTQAEYISIPVENLVKKPDYLSFEAAAAIPLGGLTGYRAMFTQGQLSTEETILITGVGGGVAALMLQMGIAMGARVLVTSGSDDKIERAMQMGASGGANYKNPDWAKELQKSAGEKGIDLVIDSAGGDGFDDLVSAVKPGGRIVFFGATAGNPSQLNLRKLFWKQVTVQGSTMGTNSDFAQMVHFFETYEIQPKFDGPYPFSSFREAYQRMMKGEQFGKIVLVPDFE